MNFHKRTFCLSAAVVAAALALAGCASATSDTGPRQPARAAGELMTPGMVMPDGSTMGAAPRSAASATNGPSAAAQMICAEEARANITKVLTLKDEPTSRSTWIDNTYTCTYGLPVGEFVLSVHESADGAAARAYANSVRARTTGAASLAGLTDTAFGAPTGLVVLVKDTDTLRVDASGLPPVFGAAHQKRTDLAYEIASDVLGCWTGDDS